MSQSTPPKEIHVSWFSKQKPLKSLASYEWIAKEKYRKWNCGLPEVFHGSAYAQKNFAEHGGPASPFPPLVEQISIFLTKSSNWKPEPPITASFSKTPFPIVPNIFWLKNAPGMLSTLVEMRLHRGLNFCHFGPWVGGSDGLRFGVRWPEFLRPMAWDSAFIGLTFCVWCP